MVSPPFETRNTLVLTLRLSSNTECFTFYSRADDLWCEILAYPEHFHMPTIVPTVQDAADDTDKGRTDGASFEGVTLNNQNVAFESSEVDVDIDECLPPSGPEIIGTSAFGNVCIEDFQNLYLAKSPSVYLMDLSGCWRGLPWPLFRTFEVGLMVIMRCRSSC